jgi:hypothetical protein
VLFRQVRVGRGGREFGMFKFRTMVRNAAVIGPWHTASRSPDTCASTCFDHKQYGQWLRWFTPDRSGALDTARRQWRQVKSPKWRSRWAAPPRWRRLVLRLVRLGRSSRRYSS